MNKTTIDESAFTRFVLRITRRFWLPRVDRVLNRAYEHGLLSSYSLHEIDHRIKYEPNRPWKDPRHA